MRKVRTKTLMGRSYYLHNNPEVKRTINRAREAAKKDGYHYTVYADEPGSVAYCHSDQFGRWEYQKPENIIVEIATYYE